MYFNNSYGTKLKNLKYEQFSQYMKSNIVKEIANKQFKQTHNSQWNKDNNEKLPKLKKIRKNPGKIVLIKISAGHSNKNQGNTLLKQKISIMNILLLYLQGHSSPD